MGTSKSSNGPSSGVPFDPPWIDDIEIPWDDIQPKTDKEILPNKQVETPDQLIAPSARFRASRRALGEYVRTGDHESLQKAIGHYSRTGMGGATNVARRMRLSTRTASALFGFMKAVREDTQGSIKEWILSLTSNNATTNEIINAIVGKVAPGGGSVDESNCRASMEQALADLLSKNPNMDLFKLSNDDIWEIIRSFLGFEAFKRLCLDIGQTFEKSLLSYKDRILRMNEMQKYLEIEIYAQLEHVHKSDVHASPVQLNSILQEALTNTFLVYEGAL